MYNNKLEQISDNHFIIYAECFYCGNQFIIDFHKIKKKRCEELLEFYNNNTLQSQKLSCSRGCNLMRNRIPGPCLNPNCEHSFDTKFEAFEFEEYLQNKYNLFG